MDICSLHFFKTSAKLAYIKYYATFDRSNGLELRDFLPISRNILQITYTIVPVWRPVNGQTWLLVDFRPLG